METPKLTKLSLTLFTIAIIALFSAGVRGADQRKPHVAVGQKAPAFEAKTTAGKTV